MKKTADVSVFVEGYHLNGVKHTRGKRGMTSNLKPRQQMDEIERPLMHRPRTPISPSDDAYNHDSNHRSTNCPNNITGLQDDSTTTIKAAMHQSPLTFSYAAAALHGHGYPTKKYL